jgi:UDP-N-acetylglucosamine 2-epimerase (non-hydrolysing)/UDP-GlcNAc3NAcA epimerase
VAVDTLTREGVAGEVVQVGDVMVDVALALQPRARERVDLVEAYGLALGAYALITAHRSGNVDDPARLRCLVDLLAALPFQAIFPVHPRTEARLRATGLLAELQACPGLILTEPLGPLELAALLCHARVVLTDSGGLQKEAYLAGVPCVTLRPSTEWTETVDTGWNVLVDLDTTRALAALERPRPAQRPPLYGDGNAAGRIVAALGRLERGGAPRLRRA